MPASRRRVIAALTIAGAAGVTVTCRGDKLPKPGEPATDLGGALAVIRQHAQAFVGLTVSEARERIGAPEIKEEEWLELGVGGTQMSASFPEYELTLFAYDGGVITASVQVIAQ